MSEAGVPPVQESSRNIYAFGLTSLFNDMASEMAYWVMPAFLASIGAGPAQLGLIEGLAESVASSVQLFSGYLADRLPRRKPIVVGGYFVANLVKPLLAFVSSWWQVLAIRFTDRFCKGMRGAPRDVMVAESTSRLGSAYGLIQSLDSAGAVLGPLAALWLLRSHGLREVFLGAAVPGFLCFAIALVGIKEVLRVRKVKASFSDASTNAAAIKSANAALPRSFYFVLCIVGLFSLGNSSDMFLVLRAQSIGISISHAPLLGLVFNVMYTLFSWPAGYWSDRLPRRAIAAAGYLIFAGVYFTFALAPSHTALWVAMGSYGLFYALTNPVLKALIVETVAPEVRGRALGIYAFVSSVAILLASLTTGELWKHYGPSVPFYCSAGIAAVSAIMLMASHRPRAANL